MKKAIYSFIYYRLLGWKTNRLHLEEAHFVPAHGMVVGV